jgi:hypothetical protein
LSLKASVSDLDRAARLSNKFVDGDGDDEHGDDDARAASLRMWP